ncbi:HEPN domain-containing protein [Nocardia salmonicida]|uniref:ApeA N-terminal domain 1-containing protein n=1 Tax=Nocardia salmonicida TaxID=53431 RepID=UPI0033D0BFD1
MVQANEEVFGTWWLAGKPDQSVAGKLVLGPKAAPQLEIYGQLVDIFDDGPYIVHGEQSNGKRISLFGVFLTDAASALRDGETATFQQVMKANGGALIGKDHLGGAREPAFARSIVEIDYLTFLATAIRTGQVADQPQPDGTMILSLPITVVSSRSGRFGDFEVTLDVRQETEAQAFSVASARLPVNYRAALLLRAEESKSVEDHLVAARHLADLVTLGMYRPADVRSIMFEAVREDGGLDRYQWWGTGLVRLDKPLDSSTRQRIAFNFDDAELPDLFPAWHELVTTAGYGVSSIIALLRETSTFHETKLLGVCGAAEALHRGFDPSRQHYKVRCKALANLVAPEIRREVVPDIDVWANHVTNARNELAHGYKPADRKVPEQVWYALPQPTLAILVLVLLTKIGISDRALLLALNWGALRDAAALGTRHLQK